MTALTPLISCLCVTRNRVHKLKRVINCFYAQSYPHKELVVVSEDDDVETLAFMAGHTARDVQHVVVASRPKLPLGDLRNIAIEKSNGAYFCQWDDDDWYHGDRLSRQIAAALDNHHPGSILTNWLIFDETRKQAYFSTLKWWEGSIMFHKDTLKQHGITYPSQAKNEDTLFMESLINKSRIYPLVSSPLYIYTAHGGNTWEQVHFEKFFKWSQKLSAETSRVVHDILEERYTHRESSAALQTQAILAELDFLHGFKQIEPADDV